MIKTGLDRLLQLETIRAINQPELWTQTYEEEYQMELAKVRAAIDDRIIIPDISKHPEEKIASVIKTLIDKLAKRYDVNVHQASGGTLEDWKTTDLNTTGHLLIFVIKKRETMRKKLSGKWKEFKSTVDNESKHYRCTEPDGGTGCSHGINDKCDHECHKIPQQTIESRGTLT